MSDSFTAIVAVVLIVFYFWLILLPVRIARARNIERKGLIDLLSVISLFIPLVWFVAVYLAYTLPWRPVQRTRVEGVTSMNLLN